MSFQFHRTSSAVLPVEFDLEFACAWCQHECRAHVVGHGAAVGRSPWGLQDAAARVSAERGAEARARYDAHLVLGLARCPACGRRSRVGLARALLVLLLALALPVLPLGLFVLLFGWGRFASTFGGVAAVYLALGWTLPRLVGLGRAWGGSNHRVQFGPAEEARRARTTQVAGRSCARCDAKIFTALHGAPCPVCDAPCHAECMPLHLKDHDGPPSGAYR